MSEFPDVDPANGTEVHHDSDAGMVAGESPSTPEADRVHETPAPEAFTAPEKLASVVHAVLATPSGDPKLQAALAALTSSLGRRLLVEPMLGLLPPLDQPDEWDAWLSLIAGAALELTSDGAEVDVDLARQDARALLVALFAAEAVGS